MLAPAFEMPCRGAHACITDVPRPMSCVCLIRRSWSEDCIMAKACMAWSKSATGGASDGPTWVDPWGVTVHSWQEA
jgi:hypothetical protein